MSRLNTLHNSTFLLGEHANIAQSLDIAGVAVIYAWRDPEIVDELVRLFKNVVATLPEFVPTEAFVTDIMTEIGRIGRYCPAVHGLVPTASSYHNLFARNVRRIVLTKILAPAILSRSTGSPMIRTNLAGTVVGGATTQFRQGRWGRRLSDTRGHERRFVGFLALKPDEINVVPCSHTVMVQPQSVVRETSNVVRVPAGSIVLWDDRLLVRESQVRPWRIDLDYHVRTEPDDDDTTFVERLLQQMAAPPTINLVRPSMLMPGISASRENGELIDEWLASALTTEVRRMVEAAKYTSNPPFPPLSVLFEGKELPYPPYSNDEARLYLEHVSATELVGAEQ